MGSERAWSCRRWAAGLLAVGAVVSGASACGEDNPPPTTRPATSGGVGGVASGGGGQVAATGGDTATGGALPTGGGPATGGVGAVGGTSGTGGGGASGGALPTGGVENTGAAPTTGGIGGSGGDGATGGLAATGGGGATGGTGGIGGTLTGGTSGIGGVAGVSGSAGLGGTPTGGTGGAAAAAGDGGTGGEPPPECPPPACGNTGQQNRICNDGDDIGLGKYRILNNLWGGRDSDPSDGQCTWSLCSGNAIAWGTEFLWTSGDPISVKSYAAAIMGWHWSNIDPASGLPVQLSQNRSIPCSWSFNVDINPEGSLNVAFDLWVHSSADANSMTTPTDEVMVWLYAFNKDDPIGTFQTSTTIGGTEWDLYEGPNGSTQVHSFLRSTYTYCDDVNLRDFLDDLVGRGSLDGSKYLIGIEAGPEVVMGEGRVGTELYSCNIE